MDLANIKKIMIGPIPYDVTIEDRILNSQNQDLNGEIYYERGTIKISKDCHPVVQKVVVLHEVIHGVLDTAGITDHQEPWIVAVSNGLIKAFMDNPDLADYLTAPVSMETEEDNA